MWAGTAAVVADRLADGRPVVDGRRRASARRIGDVAAGAALPVDAGGVPVGPGGPGPGTGPCRGVAGPLPGCRGAGGGQGPVHDRTSWATSSARRRCGASTQPTILRRVAGAVLSPGRARRSWVWRTRVGRGGGAGRPRPRRSPRSRTRARTVTGPQRRRRGEPAGPGAVGRADPVGAGRAGGRRHRPLAVGPGPVGSGRPGGAGRQGAAPGVAAHRHRTPVGRDATADGGRGTDRWSSGCWPCRSAWDRSSCCWPMSRWRRWWRPGSTWCSSTGPTGRSNRSRSGCGRPRRRWNRGWRIWPAPRGGPSGSSTVRSRCW